MAASPDNYFPLWTRKQAKQELKLRRLVKNVSPKFQQIAYSLLTRSSGRPSTTFKDDDGLVAANQLGKQIWFPHPIPLINMSHIAVGYVEHLKRKYSLPGFVEVEAGDVVVDCGAFVGGFGLSAIEKASELHIFEPAPENMKATERNFADRKNVHLNPVGLYSADDTLSFKLSSSAVEHSFLTPDDGGVVSSVDVVVRRLDTYFEERGVKPDFLKVEAEGVEIEVIEGMGELRPAKIAIDVSPERDQESPAEHLASELSKIGYETQQRHFMLFARRLSDG